MEPTLKSLAVDVKILEYRVGLLIAVLVGVLAVYLRSLPAPKLRTVDKVVITVLIVLCAYYLFQIFKLGMGKKLL